MPMAELLFNLKTALYATLWNGKLLAHWVGWFGEPGKVHRVTRYRSASPYAIKSQLDCMQRVGIDGVIATWQGPTVNPYLHNATVEMCFQCSERSMLFGLLLDPWLVKASGVSAALAVSVALNHADVRAMLVSSAYLPEKFVLDFDLGVDWTKVVSPFTPLQRHTDYSWPELDQGTLGQLVKDNASPTMRIPAVFYGFNDAGCPLPYGTDLAGWNGKRDYSQSVWSVAANSSPARIIDHQAGNLYLDTVGLVPKAAPYAALVTWNDHDEGTGIEQWASMLTGIRIGQ